VEYGVYHLTWKARHDATRAALAGEPVVTPLELFIYMGGDPDQFTPAIDRDCCADLRQHGYRPEKVPIKFYGTLETRWVRHVHWAEDEQWSDASQPLFAIELESTPR
jgi:hypothetical protein